MKLIIERVKKLIILKIPINTYQELKHLCPPPFLEIPINAYQELKGNSESVAIDKNGLEIPINAYQELKPKITSQRKALLARNSY